MPRKESKKLIVTHSGVFHVDDLFATASAILLLEKRGLKKNQIKIKRSLDPKDWENGDIVLDIGRVYDPKKDRFDHHQGIADNKSSHKNGIPYAAFGLFWKKYGKVLCGSDKVAEQVEEKLVMPIDAEDNGVEIYRPTMENVEPFTLYKLISMEVNDSRSPHTSGNRPKSPESSHANFDKKFKKLLPFAKHIIECTIRDTKNHISIEKLAKKYFDKAIDKRVVILPKYLGYSFNKMKETLVKIYPNERGGWAAMAVKISDAQFASRIYFPEKWAGLVDKELAEVSGVPDAIFCHKGLFLAVAKSREGAIALVNGMFKEAGFLPIKV